MPPSTAGIVLRGKLIHVQYDRPALQGHARGRAQIVGGDLVRFDLRQDLVGLPFSAPVIFAIADLYMLTAL